VGSPKDDPDEKGIVTHAEGGPDLAHRRPKDDPDEKGIVTGARDESASVPTKVPKMTPMKRGLLRRQLEGHN